MQVESNFGGMPGIAPKPEPIITFKDIKPGLVAVAVKSKAPVPKGTEVKVTKIENGSVEITSKFGKRTMTETELCLNFNQKK